MAADLPLMLQTAYAELMDRTRSAAFAEAFPADGVFTAKTVRGRRYWYFQSASGNGRGQKYVGPETPELLDEIARHKSARSYQRDQRGLVAMLTRAGNLPRPLPAIGDLVAALAGAGVFRLRGVLVGTVAYQTYPAVLGCRLPATALQTNDVDVAQFGDVSAAIGDLTRPMADILREVNRSFRPVPTTHRQRVFSYEADTGLRVDFLTPNRGRDTEEPRNLPALGTDAQPLRFLDFLIRDPEPAVLLHGMGVLVSVPAPQRFALHKLIVARRRRDGDPKRDKDIFQAQALLDVLVDRRPHELRAAWAEAFARGKSWQRLLGEGLGLLHPATRDRVLRTVGAPRMVVPGLDLLFVPERVSYDAPREEVRFFALAGRESIACAVGRDVLEVEGLADGTLDRGGCLEAFRRNRNKIEPALRTRYMTQPVEAAEELRLTQADLA
jgi:hypothetical protein